MTPADTAFLIGLLLDHTRRNAVQAADAAMGRLDDFEAGRSVRPMLGKRSPLPPDATDMDRTIRPFVEAGDAVIQAELDALAPRVRALIEARKGKP